MPNHGIRTALISVYDKTGIVEFARALVTEFGIEIISTGGTASLLKKNGIPVTLVEEVTGFPELLDGRVKTLHPKIHAAILADRDNPDHMRQLAEQGIKPIDMVVVNLYPFEKTVADQSCTFEQAIEMIDIGGPCLLRAAAKNHRHVLGVPASWLYELIVAWLRKQQECPTSNRNYMGGLYSFLLTARYDQEISQWMSRGPDRRETHRFIHLHAENRFKLRYGENPHQRGEVIQEWSIEDKRDPIGNVAADSEFEWSYNNYLDCDAALKLCAEIARTSWQSWRCCSVCIKHNNPSGVGVADSPLESYQHAYLGDPNAAMGGILAVNFEVQADLAEAVVDSLHLWGRNAGAGAFFLEAWMAPSFSDSAIQAIRTRNPWGKRVRLLAIENMSVSLDVNALEYRTISGGFLVQTPDLVGLDEDKWKVVTKRAPSQAEMSDLRLAWLIAKHTKSNAISICRDGMLIGNGAGQMSRIMSCRIATWLAKENGHADKLAGSVAASDAFFPFADGPELLIEAGVTAIIQPGGSQRDAETIAACDARAVAMIFTGTRHFRH